jgi:hypothetical protein
MTKAAFPNPAAGILLALLVSIASYGFIACALLGASPCAFLVDEPRGQSIMRKVGVQSPIGFRFAMFFTVVLMPAILWLCMLVF